MSWCVCIPFPRERCAGARPSVGPKPLDFCSVRADDVLMNAADSPLLATALIQRRCAAVVDELHAVASDELAEVLDAIDRGHLLTQDMQQQLTTYLRDELAGYGLLSYDHLMDNGTDRPLARRINGQAVLLLALASA